MSFIDSLMKFLSSLFGGNKTTVQTAEQPKAADNSVPMDDPRVKASNHGNGLVMSWEIDRDNPSHYWVVYQNGRQYSLGVAADPAQYIQHGIFLDTSHKVEVMTAVKRGYDLSKYSEQDVFESKVYLGKIIVV